MKHITFRKWLLPLCMAATCLSASAVDLKTRFATFRVDKSIEQNGFKSRLFEAIGR